MILSKITDIIGRGQTNRQTRGGADMKLKKITAPTIRELFINEIEHLILSGQLKIGERLPNEREMASQMDVSRTIINSGIAELSKKGFVEVVPRKGVYVADFIRNGQLETLVSVIKYNGGRLNKKTVDSLMEFRMHNESKAASLAACNRTEEDLNRLEELYTKIEAGDTVEKMAELLFEFHHVIYCATGNIIYPLVYNAFKNLVLMLTKDVFSESWNKIMIAQMRKVINAIRAKDGPVAEKEMEALILRGISELNKMPPPSADDVKQ